MADFLDLMKKDEMEPFNRVFAVTLDGLPAELRSQALSIYNNIYNSTH